MFYIKDQYAKLWSIDNSGTYPKARITTSEKNKDGEWDKSKTSSWFATFFGEAKEKASELDGTERIKITKGKITNISKKQDDGTWKSYLNVIVFDFESPNGSSNKRQETVEEEEFPF